MIKKLTRTKLNDALKEVEEEDYDESLSSFDLKE